MEKTGLVIVFALWLALQGVSALAQTPPIVDLNKGNLVWVWTKGAPPNDGDVEFFTMGCGTVSGQYTRLANIAAPTARSVSVRSVVGGNGVWYCAIQAGNHYGASGYSTEINFDAGAVPAPASALNLK